MKKLFVVIAVASCLQACGQRHEVRVPNSSIQAGEGKGGVDGFPLGSAQSTKVEKPTGDQKGGIDGFLGSGAQRSRFVESGKKQN